MGSCCSSKRGKDASGEGKNGKAQKQDDNIRDSDAASVHEEQQKNRSGLFHFFDTDDDGYVSKSEFMGAMNQLGYRMSDKEANALLRKYGVDLPDRPERGNSVVDKLVNPSPRSSVVTKNSTNRSAASVKVKDEDLFIDCHGFLAAMKYMMDSVEHESSASTK